TTIRTASLISFSSLTHIASGERSPVYEIHLDQRKLRTPGGKALLVPNEVLALALAREWDSQKNTIQRHCMHLTTLCNRVVDWQTELEPMSIVEGIMQFADTDTICFRCQEPDELVKLQRDSWDPILQWIVERYSLRPMLTNSLVSSVTMSRTDRNVLTRHFLSYNRWGLIGSQACAENLKSVFLTLAAVDGFCSATRAVELSLLEQTFQAS
ncbi:ATP synthase mitochondrial F1 complex assembly factor 2, partial [Paragonimus westermani]